MTVGKLQFTIYFSNIIQSKETKLANHIKYNNEKLQVVCNCMYKMHIMTCQHIRTCKLIGAALKGVFFSLQVPAIKIDRYGPNRAKGRAGEKYQIDQHL